MITSPVKLMITIVNRGYGEKIAALCSKCGMQLMYDVYGHGTASSEIMDFLGLDEPEKDVLCALGASSDISRAYELIEREHSLEGHGKGISFAVPLTSISVEVADSIDYDREAEIMNTESTIEVILFIVEKDMSQTAMEEAKKAGANGGTVIKCRDIRADARKIFGFTIQPEKEILMLVVTGEQKDAVMNSVCAEMYAQTGEHCVAFSAQVSDARGIKL